MSDAPGKAPVMEVRKISKSFAGNQVLFGVSFDVLPGEVHALVGENGAGKSTLMNVMTGILQPDTGEIILEGRPVRVADPKSAGEMGVSIVHQELSLSPNMTVAENIFCGREPTYGFGFINKGRMRRAAKELFSRIGLDINPDTRAGSLSVAWQQMVEISKALSLNAKVLIMDEPTSALSDAEIEHLYAIIRTLREQDVGIVYISHKLSEVFDIADRVSVLRDGALVQTMPVPSTDTEEIIRLMVGRDIKDLYPPKASRVGGEIFTVENLSLAGKVNDVSFSLREGEILGFAGLVGSGRTETARAVFGAERPDSGKITLRGREVHIGGPGDAIRQGICYLSENRKEFGLFLTMSVRRNIASSSLPAYSSRTQFLDFDKVREASAGLMETLDIRPRNDFLNIINLSGGNQQKAMLAKWLAAKPTILIADEPTRGVDIGAKVKIHQHLRRLAESGIGVIVISSELPEVLGLSDRVLVFRNGSVSADMKNDNLTQTEVMRYAAN